MQPPKESEEGILKHPVWEGGDVLTYPGAAVTSAAVASAGGARANIASTRSRMWKVCGLYTGLMGSSFISCASHVL